jgi:hypothetical protein
MSGETRAKGRKLADREILRPYRRERENQQLLEKEN